MGWGRRDLAFWQTDDCKKYPHDVIRLATKRPSSARTASRAATQSSPCFSTLEYRCSRRAERMQLQPAHLPATRGASAGHPPAGFSEKGSGSKHTSSIVLNGFFTTLELSLSSSSTSVRTPDLRRGYRALSEASCEKAGNFGSIKTRSVPGFPPPNLAADET